MSESHNAINELRKVVEEVAAEKQVGSISEGTLAKVRRTLLKLRRAHASLRQTQTDSSKEVGKAIERLRQARLHQENSKFIEAQCQFLSEKFESTQTPEFDKVSMFLPSVEEFTRQHSRDPDFVSYEQDPHQFMLSMLSNELVERKKLEESITSLEASREALQSQISKKQKFLSSISSKLSELTKSVESIQSLFPLPRDEISMDSISTTVVPFANELTSTAQLSLIAGKFSTVLPSASISIESLPDNAMKLNVVVPPLPSAVAPPMVSSLVSRLTFTQTIGDHKVSLTMDPSNIYPSVLGDILDPSVPVDRVLSNIRGSVLKHHWTLYEESVFEELKLPQVPGSAWDIEQSVSNVSIIKFVRHSFGSYSIHVKLGTQENYRLSIDLVHRTLILQRLMSTETGDMLLVSRIPDNTDDVPMLVDVSMAHTEEMILGWWNGRAEQVGPYAYGELTAIVMKCINSL